MAMLPGRISAMSRVENDSRIELMASVRMNGSGPVKSHTYQAEDVPFWQHESSTYKPPMASDNSAAALEAEEVQRNRILTDSNRSSDNRKLSDMKTLGLKTYRGSLDLFTPGLVQNVVHYLWCGRKVFEFQHYLSVRSTIKYVKPERVVIHYVRYPRHEGQYYNTWFEDIKTEFPFIYLVDLSQQPRICSSTESKKRFIIQTLQKTGGGIYVHYNTIFSRFPVEYRSTNCVDALTGDVQGFLLGRAKDGDNASRCDVTVCVSADEYKEKHAHRPVCVILKRTYYPKNAWDQTDDFSALVNTIMYGEHPQPKAAPSYQELIPNIGHVLWLGGGPMDFIFYLNCLSQIHILKVDRLYVHGNAPPTGPYWDKIRNNSKLTFVKRSWPNMVFQNKVGSISHMSDVFRADIMIRYGGFYTDVDAVWINPVPDRLRVYDVVASYDWPQLYNVYPDYIQLGVMMGRRNARFWHYVLQSMRDFKDDFFGYNGLLKPYKVFERHPDLVQISDKLQVMCWKLLCHPTWYPGFRDKGASHLKIQNFNWTMANSFHFTAPTPDCLMNETALMQGTGLFADIGKRILKAANLL